MWAVLGSTTLFSILFFIITFFVFLLSHLEEDNPSCCTSSFGVFVFLSFYLHVFTV